MRDSLTPRLASIYFILSAIILGYFVDGCWSRVSCYTNGDEMTLVPEYGTNGFKKCSSDSGCFEAWAFEKDDMTVTYQSGCDACPEWTENPAGKCKTCNSTNCNHDRARQIFAHNLLCYAGGLKKNFGDQTVYCADHITACYWLRSEEVDGEEKIVRWEAGCGTGNTYSKVSCSGCKICAGSLCNVPNELRQVEKFVNRLEKIKRAESEGSGKLEVKPTSEHGDGGGKNSTTSAAAGAGSAKAKIKKSKKVADAWGDYDDDTGGRQPAAEKDDFTAVDLDSGCQRVVGLRFLVAVLLAAAILPKTAVDLP